MPHQAAPVNADDPRGGRFLGSSVFDFQQGRHDFRRRTIVGPLLTDGGPKIAPSSVANVRGFSASDDVTDTRKSNRDRSAAESEKTVV